MTKNGYQRQLARTIAHEMMHCLEANRFGLTGSRPIKNIPNWKWEGYPEYVARRNPDQTNLNNNIRKLLETANTDNNDWMKFADSTETLVAFEEYRLLIQYCIEIKQMDFEAIMKDTTDEKTIKQQMMNWYIKQLN